MSAFIATNVFAAEGADNVANLKYFAGEGKFKIGAGLNSPFISKKDELNNNISNQKISTVKHKGYSLDLDAVYGVAPKTQIGIASNFNINEYAEQTFSGASTSEKIKLTKYFSSPNLNAKYRYLDENWVGDLAIGWDVRFSKAKLSTTTEIASYYGDFSRETVTNTFTVSAPFFTSVNGGHCTFGVTPFISLGLSGDYEYKNTDLSNGSVTLTSGSIDPQFNYGLDLAYRHNEDSIFFGVGAKINGPKTVNYSITSTATTSGSTTTTQTFTNNTWKDETKLFILPRATIGYSVDKNTALDLTATYANYGVTTTNKVDTNTQSITRNQFKNTSLVLGFNYQF
jgi:hypothetical protein